MLLSEGDTPSEERNFLGEKMKIISNYKDCIDFLASHDDKQRIFKRMEAFPYEIFINAGKYNIQVSPFPKRSLKGSYFEYHKNFICCLCFLGKPFLLTCSFKNGKFCFREFLKKDFKEKEKLYEKEFNCYRNYEASIRHIEKICKETKELFREKQIAWYLIILAFNTVWANPPLVNFPFLFKEESYGQIFQRIEQYLFQDADKNKQKPISDILKIETHGFDKKTSFRKV